MNIKVRKYNFALTSSVSNDQINLNGNASNGGLQNKMIIS